MKMSFNNIISIIVFFLMLVNSCLFAQERNSVFDKQLTKIQKASNLPGFAVAIIKNDSVLFSNGYGLADKKKKIPYTIETIQPIGSVSKTFIGFAVMKAIDQGLFTMESDINDILPFKIVNPYCPNCIIRIKHLVTHTSGLVDNDTTYIKAYALGKNPVKDLGEYLKEYFSSTGKLYSMANFENSEPGEKYNYTNIGAALTAYLVEIKANISFPDYTSKYLFEPLHMDASHWFYDENKSMNYATLYEVNRQDLPIYQKLLNKDGSLKTYSCITYPDGSLKTSVSDLTKYLIAMIKGYTGQSDLLTKESFETLFKKQFTTENMPLDMDTKEPNRAVFWAYNKRGKLSHTGSDPGVAAFISFDPSTKIGRIIVLNTQLEGEDNIKTVEYFKSIVSAFDSFESNLK